VSLSGRPGWIPVHRDAPILSFGLPAADPQGMSSAVRDAVARGEYEVDTDALALAMLTRARALRVARRGSSCSQVLIAADRIEIRRVGSCEPQSVALERSA
jgi:hypothetical protein